MFELCLMSRMVIKRYHQGESIRGTIKLPYGLVGLPMLIGGRCWTGVTVCRVIASLSRHRTKSRLMPW